MPNPTKYQLKQTVKDLKEEVADLKKENQELQTALLEGSNKVEKKPAPVTLHGGRGKKHLD